MNKWKMQQWKQASKDKNFSTPYSRVVPHHSTDEAVTSLTLEIGRDPVLSGAYGRSWTALRSLSYKAINTVFNKFLCDLASLPSLELLIP